MLLPTLGRPTMATPGTAGHDRAPRRRRRRSPARALGEEGDELVEHVAGAAAVEGADRVGLAQAEGQELPRLVLAAVVVGLVGHEEHGLAGPAQPLGDGGVLLGDPDGGVDEEQHGVGAPHALLHLAAHLGLEVGAARHPAAGVDEQEGHAQPLGLDLLAVPGDAGAVLHDGDLLAEDAVHERALADVGAADDGDDGQPAHASAFAQGDAVGGDDLDGPGQVAAGRCRRGSGRRTGRRRAAGSDGPRGSAASTRARSAPTIRPVTPVLPPKNSLATGRTRTSARPSVGPAAARAPGRPYSPVRMPTGRSRRPGERDGSIGRSRAHERRVARRVARRPVAGGRRAVDPGEEAALDARSPPRPAPSELLLEGAGHADAVLVHGEPLVVVGGRERAPGQQVVLVGGVHQPAAEGGPVDVLPVRDGVDHGLGLGRVWPRMAGSGLKREMPRGTRHSDASSGYWSSTPARVSSSTAPSLTPGHTTTWPWTVMPWSSRARSHRRLVAPRRLRSMAGRGPRGRWRGC